MTAKPKIVQAVEEILSTDLLDVGGVTYRAVDELSFEHDLYLMALVDRMGLRDPASVVPASGTREQQATALLLHTYQTGLTFELLGGLFAPDGVEWTPEVAAETAVAFMRVKDRASKQHLMAALSVALLGFFEAALGSSETSPASSDATTPAPDAASSANAPTEAPPTTASGTPSSAS